MKITILGAGISGLATGWKLSDEHQIDIIEKSNKTGGMSASFKYKDFMLDYGPHKIYTQLPGILDDFKDLIKEDLLTIPKKNKLMIQGKYFDFPIKFTQLLTRLSPVTSAKCGIFKATTLLKKEKGSSYETYLKNNFGSGIYNVLFRDYALKVWGDPKELSEELARKRIPVSGFADLIKNILFGAKKEQSAENFYYPKNGSGTICDRVVERLEENNAKIRLNTNVESINIKNNKVESITCKNEKNKKSISKTDYFVSTIPLPVMINLINPPPPKEVLEAAKNLKYRSLIILFLLLNKKKALDCNWIFFPGKDIIFNRVSEQKSFSESTCPQDKTAVYVELTCDYNDWRWNASDYDIFELAIKDLEKAKLVKRDEVEEYFTRKSHYVYPIYSKDFRKNLNIILNYLSTIKNLQTTGRQGLFNYNNTDHCIDMAKKTAEHIKKNKSTAEWNELRSYFDSYTIVD